MVHGNLRLLPKVKLYFRLKIISANLWLCFVGYIQESIGHKRSVNDHIVRAINLPPDREESADRDNFTDGVSTGMEQVKRHGSCESAAVAAGNILFQIQNNFSKSITFSCRVHETVFWTEMSY